MVYKVVDVKIEFQYRLHDHEWRIVIEFLKQAKPVPMNDRSALTTQVNLVLEDIRQHGEVAVRKYSEQFDKWSPESFRVPNDEIAAAENEVPDDLKESIMFAQEQVRNFAHAQRATMHDLEIESRPGVIWVTAIFQYARLAHTCPVDVIP